MSIYTVVIKVTGEDTVVTKNYLSPIKNGKKFLEKLTETNGDYEKVAIFDKRDVYTVSDIEYTVLDNIIIQ